MRLESVFKRATLTVAFTSALCSSESAQNTSSGGPPASPPWPSPKPAFASSWFGGSLTGFEWENPNEMAQIGKYKAVFTGWMELLRTSNFTNATAVGASQAVHMKAALGPNTAVFSYQSAWLAARFYPEAAALMGPVGEGLPPQFGDFFLVDANGKVMTDETYCAQTKTTPQADPGCEAYFWNWCNETAIDWYVNKVLRPLVVDASGKGLAYDGVFLDNSNDFNPRGASNPTVSGCDTDSAKMQLHIAAGKMLAAAQKWPIFSSTKTGTGDATETQQLWDAGIGYSRFWEFFTPTAGSMENLYNETQRGLPLVVHAPTSVKRHPPIGLVDSLAAFLVATGGADHTYFQYSSGWYDNNWRWDPLFDVEYGVASGPPVVTEYGVNRTGVVWERNFSSGAKVTVNCTPPDRAHFEWCVGNITNATTDHMTGI